ncbi:MAG: hypothetical protein IIA45_12800 [Bacteroidetes bacterium]|nr:hypothetical protein [Bacteroidota bacterium]
MRLITNQILIICGAIIGGVAGLLYWKYVGCVSGRCTIWSNSGLSTFYGIFLGALSGASLKGMFVGNKAKKNKPSSEQR